MVDASRAPIGWVDTASVRGDSVTGQRRQPQRDVGFVEANPLRDLLNSALSSPSGRCVVTDESGALIGTASDHDVIEAIRRAKEARTAA